MNKIVREHYPASKLPDDLRQGIDPDRSVTIIISEEEHPPKHVMTLEEILADRRPPYRTMEEIDADIRRQREAWDH